MQNNKWPKKMPEFTEEQLRIKDDFMHRWLEAFPDKYGAMEIFNQNYPAYCFKRDMHKKTTWNTLEIGGGLGSHIPFEDLTKQTYTILELRENILETLAERHPDVYCILGDCQSEYAEENTFDRVIAIHVLEHLPNLPEAIRQMHRVLKPDGVAHVVIPCEGSLAYSFCRKISAERMFRKLYHMDYDWYIKSEHINRAKEIIEEIEPYFDICYKRNFPIPVPLEFCNIAIGMTLYPKK
jgi:ubiquinone/menaquinone biosynthesis C-methylase UbiE